LNEYRSVAEQINERKDIGLVCIQHEFGLSVVNMAIISLLILALNKPIATIFHTLPNPDQKKKKIVNAIIDLSDRIVVLTKKSQEILTNYYNCPISKLR
jgi:hypothetical protein